MTGTPETTQDFLTLGEFIVELKNGIPYNSYLNFRMLIVSIDDDS